MPQQPEPEPEPEPEIEPEPEPVRVEVCYVWNMCTAVTFLELIFSETACAKGLNTLYFTSYFE